MILSFTRYYKKLITIKQQRILKRVIIIYDEFLKKATRKTNKIVFPDSLLLVCFFHFTKAIWNKEKKEGLCSELNQNPQYFLFYKRNK